MSTIQIVNPFSGEPVEHDISGLTDEQFAAYVELMDPVLRDRLGAMLAPCSTEQFLCAWVDEVGPDVAGRVILSS